MPQGYFSQQWNHQILEVFFKEGLRWTLKMRQLTNQSSNMRTGQNTCCAKHLLYKVLWYILYLRQTDVCKKCFCAKCFYINLLLVRSSIQSTNWVLRDKKRDNWTSWAAVATKDIYMYNKQVQAEDFLLVFSALW